jgi:hypothetical protein
VYASVTLLANGKVLVAGGSKFGSYHASAELYDPSSGRFASTVSMAVARSHHTATLLADGRVLIVGGDDGRGGTRLAEIYNP